MYSSTGAKSKPTLDENGFQQLLAAAYVLQQHNDSLRSKDPRLDPAWIFSQITETEALVRQQSLSFSDAAALIGDRLCKMTGAVSVSVCRSRPGVFDCVAESGVGARIPGCSIVSNSVAAKERLTNGRQFQSLGAQSDTRLDKELCRELGVHSLLAVPVLREEELAGVVEVRWGLPDALHECDVRTSRLMAALLGEALQWDAADTERKTVPPSDSGDPEKGSGSLATYCRVCGREFLGDEAFCGICSMPRVAANSSNDGLQSKWASMWFMQQAHDTKAHTARLDEHESQGTQAKIDRPAATSPWVVRTGQPLPAERAVTGERERERPELSQVMQQTRPSESFAEPPREAHSKPINWAALMGQVRRGLPLNLRISKRAVALTMFSVAMIFLASVWLSLPSTSSAQLTWFESILVELGLAEVPQRAVPALAGNPDARVWEDVHTALYYCPNSELYGKTPGGRFSTQRAAQQDQFEAATRVPCE